MVSAHPVEGLLLDVGALGVLDPVVGVRLAFVILSRCASCQGALRAFTYPVMCSMFLPRSRRSTLSPASVSSLAAHPPLIPEPTTTASKVRGMV
jgi:hypothetical protein